MSGFSDALGDVGDWAESVPGALKQAGKDVEMYPWQVEQAVRKIQEGFGQGVADPIAKWAGLSQPYAEGDPAAPPLADNEGDISGKKYKFKAEDLNPSEVEDVTSSAFQGQQDPAFAETLDKGGKGFQDIDPGKLTDKEYDALTKEASKGNKLAQGILVKGKYKEQDFPSLSQDLSSLTDPFVKALSGMPALATSLQAQQNAKVAPYDFTNAESQVNSLLSQVGSVERATPSAQTTGYANAIQNVLSQGANQLNTGGGGQPSIMEALGGLGPAAKLSQKATPDEALLSALLSHQQYEDIYEGAFPTGGNNPAWLTQLMQQITGQGGAGNFSSPTAAALGAAGALPSPAASPTGSNA